jgi:hypothetical protein
MTDLHKAIYNIYTNVKHIDGDTQETIRAWDEEKNLITIDWTQVNDWVNPNQYKIDREKEYPSIVDQLDDIYHNGIDGWKETIKSTKDKFPKE